MSNPIFNDTIRTLTVGFGNLFNNITVVRFNTDGTEAQRFLCPIEYASKEKYVARLEGDPSLDRKIQVSLPALSFEMTGMNYDASRKQVTNVKNFHTTNGTTSAQYVPVPYNFDFNLYAYVRNEEDGNQIIERVLPFFTPDYTIKLNMIPQMGITTDVPIILNSVQKQDDYEGSWQTDTRTIIWTLNFTVKGFVYGGFSQAGLITHTITNIYKNITPTDNIAFTLANTGGIGQYQAGEIVYQGYSFGTSTATAQVIGLNSLNNQITLTNINGNFVSTMPIIGAKSGATHTYTTTNFANFEYAKIDVVPSQTSNVSNNWVANTTITEY